MGLLLSLISNLFFVYSILLVIYILMSWVPSTRDTGFGRLLERICEPYLGVFRKIIPPFGMIDFSPIVALLVLNLALKGLNVLFFNFLI